jgi:hypothetical protein
VSELHRATEPGDPPPRGATPEARLGADGDVEAFIAWEEQMLARQEARDAAPRDSPQDAGGTSLSPERYREVTAFIEREEQLLTQQEQHAAAPEGGPADTGGTGLSPERYREVTAFIEREEQLLTRQEPRAAARGDRPGHDGGGAVTGQDGNDGRVAGDAGGSGTGVAPLRGDAPGREPAEAASPDGLQVVPVEGAGNTPHRSRTAAMGAQGRG